MYSRVSQILLRSWAQLKPSDKPHALLASVHQVLRTLGQFRIAMSHPRSLNAPHIYYTAQHRRSTKAWLTELNRTHQPCQRQTRVSGCSVNVCLEPPPTDTAHVYVFGSSPLPLRKCLLALVGWGSKHHRQTKG